jgi:hypothetical protein
MASPCSLVQTLETSVDQNLFNHLHPEGRELIRGWADKGAAVPADGDASEYFEGFIFLWFAVNGWGACVSETDADRQWVNAVAGDHRLTVQFANALDHDDAFRAAVSSFAELWPIFKSSEIRRRRIIVPSDCSRRERVHLYLQNGISHEPACWEEHDGQAQPIDWVHIFATLYRVRCNLFHGEKTLDSENDRRIVVAAYSVLRPTVRLLGLV